MTEYRYVFSTLRTEEVVAEIALFGTYMDMELNTGGTFTGTFQLDQTGQRNQDLLTATIPGRTFVAVERNGTPIWAGPVGSRVYQSQSKTIQLSAQSFENYPNRQRVENDLNFAGEQRNIFRSLWLDMQSIPERNLNINVPPVFGTSVTKGTSVLATDAKYYGELMSELADADDGFDWYISVSKSGSHYIKNLLIGYPNLGSPLGTNTTVLEYPGNILNYYMTDSISNAATDIFVNGSGEGSTMILGRFEFTDMLTQGFPRWDIDVSRKDVSDQANADGMAAQEAIKRKPPMTVIKATVKANVVPVFGTLGLGDTCQLVIKDARNPDGFISTTRMVRWELTPQQSESSEEANYIFAGDPDVASH